MNLIALSVRAGNRKAARIASARTDIGNTDVYSFPSVREAYRAVQQFSEDAFRTYSSFSSAATEANGLRSLVKGLSKYIIEILGMTVDSWLTANGFQVQTEYATLSNSLGYPISSANIA